jgi:hypothetical protein
MPSAAELLLEAGVDRAPRDCSIPFRAFYTFCNMNGRVSRWNGDNGRWNDQNCRYAIISVLLANTSIWIMKLIAAVFFL